MTPQDVFKKLIEKSNKKENKIRNIVIKNLKKVIINLKETSRLPKDFIDNDEKLNKICENIYDKAILENFNYYSPKGIEAALHGLIENQQDYNEAYTCICSELTTIFKEQLNIPIITTQTTKAKEWYVVGQANGNHFDLLLPRETLTKKTSSKIDESFLRSVIDTD